MVVSVAARGVTVSIVMPVLDEEGGIEDKLAALAPLRRQGAEVIVVEGGSADRSLALAAGRCDRVLVAPRGRAAIVRPPGISLCQRYRICAASSKVRRGDLRNRLSSEP